MPLGSTSGRFSLEGRWVVATLRLRMRITTLGAGAWGTALAQLAAENQHETTLWTWQEEHAVAMREHRENREFLPGVPLHPSLKLQSDLSSAVEGADLIVVVVPSHAVRQTLTQVAPHVPNGAGVVCASKGIEAGTLQLMSEVIEECLREAGWTGQFGVISGPSFAKEVARRVPTNLVAASEDQGFAEQVQKAFSNEWLRVYSSGDPVGVEIGGALKNVIAIAAGACDGLGLGANTRAALITRGIAEMARLVTAKGGQVLTTAGLAGMGDLVLTCTGDLSRNRTLGHKLGSGVGLKEALESSDGVAEGYLTAKSTYDLAVRLGVDLPICEAVYSVLHDGKEPSFALKHLLSRPLRAEWE